MGINNKSGLSGALMKFEYVTDQARVYNVSNCLRIWNPASLDYTQCSDSDSRAKFTSKKKENQQKEKEQRERIHIMRLQ